MISIIVATDKKGAIGRNNDIPWHLSDDLKRFKTITMGHTVIMGRNTWESLPFKPLKGRRNIVVSTSMPESDLYESARNIEEAMKMTSSEEEAFIIGGAKVYEQTLEYADNLIITVIDHIFEDTDRFFPEIDTSIWEIKERSGVMHDAASNLDYEYITYSRKI